MADWEAFAEGFRFDIWANRLWLECIERKGLGEPDRALLGHILSAQKVWVKRVQGESMGQMPVVDLTEEAMADIHRQWIEVLQTAGDDRVIDYHRTTGEALSSKLSDIAAHVINHGTYHRGELRGLCRVRSDEDFPETDRLRYVFATQGTRL